MNPKTDHHNLTLFGSKPEELKRGPAPETRPQAISIRGAREHNLKDISCDIPHHRLTVVTGPSGAGKTSLVFDVLGKEAERRFLSGQKRRGRFAFVEAPQVDAVTGLPFTMAIKAERVFSPLGSIGTLSGVYELLRTLFSVYGTPHCPKCGKKLDGFGPSQLKQVLSGLSVNDELQIGAVIFGHSRQDEPNVSPDQLNKLMAECLRLGFYRIVVDGEEIRLDDAPVRENESGNFSQVFVLVDQFRWESARLARLLEAVHVAEGLGDGDLAIEIEDQAHQNQRKVLLSRYPRCGDCGFVDQNIGRSAFSYYSREGRCPSCLGRGMAEEATRLRRKKPGTLKQRLIDPKTCATCGGARLTLEKASYSLQGWSFAQTLLSPISQLQGWVAEYVNNFDAISTNTTDLKHVARQCLLELSLRLSCLQRLGVEYLTLTRAAETLSSGEIQRVQLAWHLGSQLSGMLFLVDEPTSGLHPSDSARLIEVIREFVLRNNTVVVVDHDRQLLEAADFIVELGPAGGGQGGEITASGDRAQVIPQILARQVLDSTLEEEVTRLPQVALTLSGVNKNNLKNLELSLPLQQLVAVTGVSGSGKSSLVRSVLGGALRIYLAQVPHRLPPEYVGEKKLSLKQQKALGVQSVRGWEVLERVIDCTMTGRNFHQHSVVASLGKVIDPIREIYALTSEARVRGYQAKDFSFGGKGGCLNCKGVGRFVSSSALGMDSGRLCVECQGTRLRRELVEIRYKGRSLPEVLRYSVDDASEFFQAIPNISTRLQLIHKLGLGYLVLGQAGTTLSTGELQRLRLARHLAVARSSTLYLFDEPTMGLSLEEVRCCIRVLRELVQAGNSVVVVEHNPDFIAHSDYVIDLGPAAGEQGGEIIAAGTPREVHQNPRSGIGPYLTLLTTD